MWYVYILRSTLKDWYYVGSTNRLDERLGEHNNGKVHSTKPYVPLKRVYVEEFLEEKEARAREKQIKEKRIEKEGIIASIGQ